MLQNGTFTTVYEGLLKLWLSVAAPNISQKDTEHQLWKMAREWLHRIGNALLALLAGLEAERSALQSRDIEALNAAMDRTVAVPNFRQGRRHRSVESRTVPGGKGINKYIHERLGSILDIAWNRQRQQFKSGFIYFYYISICVQQHHY